MALLLTAQHAHADGWWEACDCNGDGQATPDAAQVGTGIGMMGLVAYGIGRKRRTR